MDFFLDCLYFFLLSPHLSFVAAAFAASGLVNGVAVLLDYAAAAALTACCYHPKMVAVVVAVECCLNFFLVCLYFPRLSFVAAVAASGLADDAAALLL